MINFVANVEQNNNRDTELNSNDNKVPFTSKGNAEEFFLQPCNYTIVWDKQIIINDE